MRRIQSTDATGLPAQSREGAVAGGRNYYVIRVNGRRLRRAKHRTSNIQHSTFNIQCSHVTRVCVRSHGAITCCKKLEPRRRGVLAALFGAGSLAGFGGLRGADQWRKMDFSALTKGSTEPRQRDAIAWLPRPEDGLRAR